MRRAKRVRAREMYIRGASMREIADELGCSLATVYRWKEKDPIDWDTEKFAYSINPETVKRETLLSLTSINAEIRRILENLQQDDIDGQLDKIERCIKALKESLHLSEQYEPALAPTNLIRKVFEIIIDIAAEEKRTEFLQFLNDNIHEIEQRIVKWAQEQNSV